jgi:hypothetical protein
VWRVREARLLQLFREQSGRGEAVFAVRREEDFGGRWLVQSKNVVVLKLTVCFYPSRRRWVFLWKRRSSSRFTASWLLAFWYGISWRFVHGADDTGIGWVGSCFSWILTANK